MADISAGRGEVTRPGEWDTRLDTWRVNASNTGGEGSVPSLAGHPEGTLDENDVFGAPAWRCTQVTGMSLRGTGSGRKSETRQAKDLVGFNTPWRFESSLRHQHPTS